jgi:hypothetical protein
MTRRPARKTRPSPYKPMYTLTIKGDEPTQSRLFGKDIKGSNKFTNTTRQTRFLTSTSDKDKALRIKQQQEKKGNTVVITESY